MPGPRRPNIPRIPIRPLVVQPPVVQPPAVRPPIRRPPIVPPSDTGIARQPPPGLDSKQLAEWHVARIHEHEDLRARSFYDTGLLLKNLLALREEYGAKDIKELVSKAKLGMSHMTANKYMRVATIFERATAIEQGVEKCYALTIYAKAIGRPDDAPDILGADEPVSGVPGLTVRAASASKLYGAARAIKKAAREKEPPEIQARHDQAVQSTEKWVRQLGFRGANAEIVRKHGEPRVAIYITLETAEALQERVIGAFAKLGPSLARRKPALVAPLRAAGWKLRGTG